MSLEQAITQAVTHALRIHPWGPDLPYPFYEYVDRVMPDVVEAVVAQLGLTEEHRTLTDGWVQPTRDAMYHAVGLQPPVAVIAEQRRYVSPWQDDAL